MANGMYTFNKFNWMHGWKLGFNFADFREIIC